MFGRCALDNFSEKHKMLEMRVEINWNQCDSMCGIAVCSLRAKTPFQMRAIWSLDSYDCVNELLMRVRKIRLPCMEVSRMVCFMCMCVCACMRVLVICSQFCSFFYMYVFDLTTTYILYTCIILYMAKCAHIYTFIRARIEDKHAWIGNVILTKEPGDDNAFQIFWKLVEQI